MAGGGQQGPPEVMQCVKVGKLNLVDLAGSERVHITGATGTAPKTSNLICCMKNILLLLEMELLFHCWQEPRTLHLTNFFQHSQHLRFDQELCNAWLSLVEILFLLYGNAAGLQHQMAFCIEL